MDRRVPAQRLKRAFGFRLRAFFRQAHTAQADVAAAGIFLNAAQIGGIVRPLPDLQDGQCRQDAAQGQRVRFLFCPLPDGCRRGSAF